MTTIQIIDTQYIRYANRSLETVQMISQVGQKNMVWIYNYEGKHFRIFGTEKDAWDFLDNKSDDCLIDFECEYDLDNFLQQLKF